MGKQFFHFANRVSANAGQYISKRLMATRRIRFWEALPYRPVSSSFPAIPVWERILPCAVAGSVSRLTVLLLPCASKTCGAQPLNQSIMQSPKNKLNKKAPPSVTKNGIRIPENIVNESNFLTVVIGSSKNGNFGVAEKFSIDQLRDTTTFKLGKALPIILPGGDRQYHFLYLLSSNLCLRLTKISNLGFALEQAYH